MQTNLTKRFANGFSLNIAYAFSKSLDVGSNQPSFFDNLDLFIIDYLASGGALQAVLLFAFTLGLFAALITTADSLLLVAAQMMSLDFLGLSDKGEATPNGLGTARIVLVVVACTSFAMFVLFRLLDLDVVQLVFAIYGAQLALFPATAMAILSRHRPQFRLSAAAAMISIVGGFASAWGMALYGRFTGDQTLLFNAPVAALGASLILLLVVSAFTRRRSADDAPPINLELRPAEPDDLDAIMAIAKLWPTHFVVEGLGQIERDFKRHKATVAIATGRLVGFLVWTTNKRKVELLWLAVDPVVARQHVGTRLVSSVLAQAHAESEVFLKTATPDSIIPGTAFDGPAYSTTIDFFRGLGFETAATLENHWGPQNHALIMSKRLRT